MIWYISAIKNYCNFSGRARRREYWMFLLFNCIFTTAAVVLDCIIGLWISLPGGKSPDVISSIYGLFIMLPTLSLSFRRLHDVGKSAWWQLIALVPVIGWIWLFIYSVREGTRGANRYGADPKCLCTKLKGGKYI